MKIPQILTISAIGLLAHVLPAKVINNEELKFQATFPGHEDWTEPIYGTPTNCAYTWTSQNHKERVLIHLSAICAPWPDKKPTFEENALQWEKGVVESATEKTSSSFTDLGGVIAYEIRGKMLYGPSEHYFIRWMADHNDIQYQLTIISQSEPDTEKGALNSFLNSFKVLK